MGAGLIQLVAYGIEDLFLTRDPQITFFKITYRRHTVFATETTEQHFKVTPEFGNKYSCVIAKDGDLVNNLALQIVLPEIPKFKMANGLDTLTKVAWVHNIGHVLLKYVEIEINGQVIDKHYGEWMHLWSTLTTSCPDSKSIDKLTGNIPELYEFTNGKAEYTLYIPFYFWFCRNSGLSLPLLALQYSDVKVNIELAELEKCLLITPTDYIVCTDSLVNFKTCEYLFQKGSDGIERYGQYITYDIINKRLYYRALGQNKLTGEVAQNGYAESTSVKEAPLLFNGIQGNISKYIAYPQGKSITHHYVGLKNIQIKKVALLITYVYISNEERRKLATMTQDYLIEQLNYTPSVYVDSTNKHIKLAIDQPCKLIVWVAQYEYIERAYDAFNYTDSHTQDGKPLIERASLLLNSSERVNTNLHVYYENIQPLQHTQNHLPAGAGMYSFAILPTDLQPSGTTNMSQIEQIDLCLKMNYRINPTRKAKVRAYAVCYNIWRVSNGLSGTLFVKNS